jgi:UDP-N-acetylglucosamine 2-epimerase
MGRFACLGAEERLILVTGQRREMSGPGIERVCAALRAIAQLNDSEIVYPVHLNANVPEPVQSISGQQQLGIHLIEPLDPAFLIPDAAKLSHPDDSGGVKEEAPSLRRLVVPGCQRTAGGRVCGRDEAGLSLVEAIANAAKAPNRDGI